MYTATFVNDLEPPAEKVLPMLADLRAEAAARAAQAAEAVVGANLDASTQNDLVEAYISQVGGAR